jgi:transcriptional regulator with XRE-family HTH domain
VEENDKRNQFKTWIMRKWAEWDAREGKRTTQQDLAGYLGIPRPSLANYLLAKKLPEGENLKRIADRFGVEAYVFAGNGLRVDNVPPVLVSRIASAFDEISNTLAARHISPDSEQAKIVSDEIMKRWGFNSTATK